MIIINPLKPFVLSVFSPSDNILNIIKNIESKYNIDYDNTCVLFLRGGDKQRETKIPMYEEYTNKVKSEHHNENLRSWYLIQSDETEFIEEMYLYLPIFVSSATATLGIVKLDKRPLFNWRLVKMFLLFNYKE